MDEQKSFFLTLPGIITAIAGLITAIAGLILALHQIGVIGRDAAKDNQTASIEVEKPGAEMPTRPGPKPLSQPQEPAPTQPETVFSQEPGKDMTDGWAIIGYAERGTYYDLALNVPGGRPAVAKKYVAVKDFRLVQKRQLQRGEQTITLGMVHRGDTVEVLDLYLEPPSTRRMPVHAKLRTVLHPIGERSR